jgi:signal peptidase I
MCADEITDDLDEEDAAEAVLPPTTATTKARRPWLAALLTLLCPGLGQVYNGQALKGLLLHLAFFAVVTIGRCTLLGSLTGTVVLLIVVANLVLLIAFEAFRSALRVGDLGLRWYNRWWLYCGIVIAYAALRVVGEPFLAMHVVRYHTYSIPSGAMEPTLTVGDRLIVDMWAFRAADPERGDVIVFRFPSDPRRDFVKRCVAVPGDTVEIRDKVLYVNGVAQAEPYVQHTDRQVFDTSVPERNRVRDQLPATTLASGCFFTLGDNRDMSFDSRFWGCVDRELLRGRVAHIYWARDRSRLGAVP